MTDTPVAWLRDLDGTGSYHACAEGDPGSFPVYGEPQTADLLEALTWIDEIASANHDDDEKLRSQGARTLRRISDRARAAILKAARGVT